MKIDERVVQAVTVLDLSGRMTADEDCSALKERVRKLGRDGHAKVLLNLERLSYVDSSAVAQIVSSYITANRSGGALKLLNPTARIRDLFRLAKLSDIFETFDAEQAGIASFSKPAVDAFHPRW